MTAPVPDALTAEPFAEAGSLERVAIDSNDNAATPYRLGLDGPHKLYAEPVSATIVEDPQPLDLDVTTPTKSIDAVACRVVDRRPPCPGN